ncbi:hypothetical protein Droror1_Dr00014997 [Drosera rotundifolia]
MRLIPSFPDPSLCSSSILSSLTQSPQPSPNLRRHPLVAKLFLPRRRHHPSSLLFRIRVSSNAPVSRIEYVQGEEATSPALSLKSNPNQNAATALSSFLPSFLLPFLIPLAYAAAQYAARLLLSQPRHSLSCNRTGVFGKGTKKEVIMVDPLEPKRIVARDMEEIRAREEFELYGYVKSIISYVLGIYPEDLLDGKIPSYTELNLFQKFLSYTEFNLFEKFPPLLNCISLMS